MRIAVLGTGMVGRAIAGRLAGLGEPVMMGARTKDNPTAAQWAAESGAMAGDFAAAARFGDVVFNCVSGVNAVAALTMAGADALAGKVLIDVTNPLDTSAGGRPTLSVCNTDSLGETIQRSFPQARVVKTLCTVNASVMVDPAQLPGEHLVYLSGDDAEAKDLTRALLERFGWRRIVDLGGIETARGQEMAMALWLALWGKLGTPRFNFALVEPTDQQN